MPLIGERERRVLQERLQELAGPLEIEVFTRDTRLFIPGRDCPGCEETVRLLEELCQLHPSLRLVVRDLDRDTERARELGIERAPAVVVHGRAGGRVRFTGPPLGYEFATLVETLVDAGRSGPVAEAPEPHVERLEEAGQPVHLRVFFTPT